MEKKPVLGRGLSALLPGSVSTHQQQPSNPSLVESSKVGGATRYTPMGNGVQMVPLTKISPNEFQPRRDFELEPLKELAESIKIQGVIQPLIIRPSKDGFQLIAGERRWRASRMAGLKEVPAIVRASTDRESLEIALIENLQRENLNCIEEAMSYFQLMEEFGLTQDAVATRVGKDRSTVANSVRLLKLPDQIIQDLRKGILSLGHGKALLGLEGVCDFQKLIELRNQITHFGWSVRETEKAVQKVKASLGNPESLGRKKRKKSLLDDPAWKAIQENWEKALNTRVQIKGGTKKGKIIIDYYSLDDFNRLTDQVLKG